MIQLPFPQGLDFRVLDSLTCTDQVLAQEPYASRGQRNTLNSNDGIYQDELLLDATQASDGYTAMFDIGLQLD
jgi:hypothetical protein